MTFTASIWNVNIQISTPHNHKSPKVVIMFIESFGKECDVGRSMRIKLPRRGLKLDPTANRPRQCRFQCDYHDDGITVTLTRLEDIKVDDKDINNDLNCYQPNHNIEMRVYDPSNESVPDFDSKIYLYLGVDDETVPLGTTIAIIDPSVKIIQSFSFLCCTNMKRCILHDKVEAIKFGAFAHCISLDALFVPSSLKIIDANVFAGCRSIRILPLPLNLDIQNVRNAESREEINDVIKAKNRHHRKLSPLRKTCLDINVSAQAIHDCILTHGTAAAYNVDHHGMTPMHILALNPHATKGSILACFEANMSAIFVRCGKGRDEHSTIGGKSPLECLMEYDLESHTLLVTALCVHREAYS